MIREGFECAGHLLDHHCFEVIRVIHTSVRSLFVRNLPTSLVCALIAAFPLLRTHREGRDHHGPRSREQTEKLWGLMSSYLASGKLFAEGHDSYWPRVQLLCRMLPLDELIHPLVLLKICPSFARLCRRALHPAPDRQPHRVHAGLLPLRPGLAPRLHRHCAQVRTTARHRAGADPCIR